MSENLPINVDAAPDQGTITYATEVISTIVGVATAEVEGIASLAGPATISDILGRSKNITRGVKVEVGAEEVAVDVSVIVDYGMPIQRVCRNVQENIRKSIETMTGLHVIKVDVHVLGVSFEKENQEMRQSQETARLTTGAGMKQQAPAEAPKPYVESIVAEELTFDDIAMPAEESEVAVAPQDDEGEAPADGE